MLFLIASQAVLLPIAVSAALNFDLNQRFGIRFQQRLNTLFYSVAWIGIYIWIVNVPNLPPRLATDWLWLMALACMAAEYLLPRSVRNGVIFSVFVLFNALMLWPVIHYDFSWSSHWQVLTELLLASFVFGCMLGHWRVAHSRWHYSGWVVTTGIAGILTIISSSMLLGLLLVSLSFVHLVPSLKRWFNSREIYSISFMLLSVSLLLLARIYAELPFVSFFMLLFALLSMMLLRLKSLWGLIFPILGNMVAVSWVFYHAYIISPPVYY